MMTATEPQPLEGVTLKDKSRHRASCCILDQLLFVKIRLSHDKDLHRFMGGASLPNWLVRDVKKQDGNFRNNWIRGNDICRDYIPNTIHKHLVRKS